MGRGRKDGERGDDGEQGECDQAEAVQDLGGEFFYHSIMKLKFVESESGKWNLIGVIHDLGMIITQGRRKRFK